MNDEWKNDSTGAAHAFEPTAPAETTETQINVTPPAVLTISVQAGSQGFNPFQAPDPERWFTIWDVATILDSTYNMAQYRVQIGRIKGVRQPNNIRPQWLISETALRAYMDQPTSKNLHKNVDFSRVK